MKTYERVCIKDFEQLKRGKIYLTSAEENGSVTVFTSQWIHGVPVDIFAGEIVFTEGQRGKWAVNGLDPEYLPTSQRNTRKGTCICQIHDKVYYGCRCGDK